MNYINLNQETIRFKKHSLISVKKGILVSPNVYKIFRAYIDLLQKYISALTKVISKSAGLTS